MLSFKSNCMEYQPVCKRAGIQYLGFVYEKGEDGLYRCTHPYPYGMRDNTIYDLQLSSSNGTVYLNGSKVSDFDLENCLWDFHPEYPAEDLRMARLTIDYWNTEVCDEGPIVTYAFEDPNDLKAKSMVGQFLKRDADIDLFLYKTNRKPQLLSKRTIKDWLNGKIFFPRYGILAY